MLIGSFAPSRYQYQHFFAFIPLMALAVAYGTRHAFARHRFVSRGALFLLGMTSFVLDFRAAEKDGYAWIGELGRPERWFPVRAHRLGEEIRARVPAGKVLTIAPGWPVEAGLDVYPEFANGPFAWRLAHLLEQPKRARFQIVAPSDLDEFLAKDPPAAVLTGFPRDDIEKPFRSYAKREGYGLSSGKIVCSRSNN